MLLGAQPYESPFKKDFWKAFHLFHDASVAQKIFLGNWVKENIHNTATNYIYNSELAANILAYFLVIFLHLEEISFSIFSLKWNMVYYSDFK